MDTGAAGNLSGDMYINNYTSRVLMKINLSIFKEPGTGSFSGISGDALTCNEIWTVPIFLGGGTGQTSFQSHILVNSKLPPLLSLEAMKSQGIIIDTCNDRMLYPIAQGVYQIFAITYNGHHFILPIDKLEDKQPAEYVSMSVVRKTPEEIKLAQPDSGEYNPNLDLRERKRARDSVRFEAWAKDVEKQVAQALLAGKPLPELAEDQWKKFSEKMRKRDKFRPLGPPPALTSAEAKHERWDFWEWFGGSGTMTKVAVQNGLRCGPNISWETGWDISDPEHQKELRRLHLKYKPRLMMFEPDCQFWCILPNNGTDMEVREHLRMSDVPALKLMVEMATAQDERGDFFLMENPWQSELWKSDHWMKMVKLKSCLVQSCWNDFCRYGFRDPCNFKFIRKRTEWRGSYPLGLNCRLLCKGHATPHQWCRGETADGRKRSRLARSYPVKLCNAFVQDFMGGLYSKTPGMPHDDLTADERKNKRAGTVGTRDQRDTRVSESKKKRILALQTACRIEEEMSEDDEASLPTEYYGEPDGDTDETDESQEGLKIYSGMKNNCLLYTSPSPRDGLLSRMPSSA